MIRRSVPLEREFAAAYVFRRLPTGIYDLALDGGGRRWAKRIAARSSLLQKPRGGIASMTELVPAVEILQHLRQSTEAHDDEAVFTGLGRALAAIVRGQSQGQLSRSMRHDLVAALFQAEDAARAVLPRWFYDDRVRHGCVAAFGLINAWAESLGSDERRAAVPAGAHQIVRIVANDLDSLCAGLELERLKPVPPVTAAVLSARPSMMH